MKDSKAFETRYAPIAFWLIALGALVVGGLILMPFYPAILWAVVFSVLLFPIYRKIEKRIGATMASLTMVVLTLLLIVVPIGLIGSYVGIEVNDFLTDIKQNKTNGSGKLTMATVLHEVDSRLEPIRKQMGVDLSLQDWVEENKQELTSKYSQPVAKFLISLGRGAFTMVIALLTMFFLLRDGHKLRDPALELIPLPREKSEALLVQMAATIRAVFNSVVLVALIQGIIASITYWILGIPGAVMWGLITMFFCIVPLVGAPAIYVPWALILASQGHYVEAMVLLGVGFGIISTVDNLLRPFFIGMHVELHPMAIFFSLLGGVILMGPVGIMGGPLMLTVLLALQKIIREAGKQPTATEQV